MSAMDVPAKRVARPGIACQGIDRAARKVINDAGYGDIDLRGRFGVCIEDIVTVTQKEVGG